MDKDLVQGPVGNVGHYDVAIKAGVVVVSLSAAVSPVSAELKVSLSTDELLDKVAAAIPGQVDDAVIALIKVALKVA